MSGGFTPGPWAVGEYGVKGGDGSYVIQACDGHVYDEYDSDSATVEIDNPADRALVAAAPDLFEALVTLGEALGTVTVPKGHPLLAAGEKANAALAKARGTITSPIDARIEGDQA